MFTIDTNKYKIGHVYKSGSSICRLVISETTYCRLVDGKILSSGLWHQFDYGSLKSVTPLELVLNGLYDRVEEIKNKYNIKG